MKCKVTKYLRSASWIKCPETLTIRALYTLDIYLFVATGHTTTDNHLQADNWPLSDRMWNEFRISGLKRKLDMLTVDVVDFSAAFGEKWALRWAEKVAYNEHLILFIRRYVVVFAEYFGF